jgi:SpoVK/Ycf46/Vps4 family AAA+-type ATPase
MVSSPSGPSQSPPSPPSGPSCLVSYVRSHHPPIGIRQIFQRARAEAPCVLVLEDINSLITDQNRSFFLNEVDGLEDNDGLLLVLLAASP